MLKIILVENLQSCYQKWEQRLHRCVAAQGTILKGITLMLEKIKILVNKKISLITFLPQLKDMWL